MLQKLRESDREAILAYVGAEPEMNLFFIGDVENYGVDSETVELWADVQAGRWAGLVLRFMDSYCYYSREACPDMAGTAAFLRGRTVDCITGKQTLLEQLASYFPGWQLEPTYLSRCDAPAAAPLPAGVTLRALTAGDADALMALYAGIAEFAVSSGTPEKREKEKQTFCSGLAAGSIGVGAFADGQLVSAVTSSADNSRSAMLIGMATRPGWRGRGLAAAVMAQAVRTLLAGGRQCVCLFYDNPAAGRIYRRLGFAERGAFAMLHPQG